MEDNARKYILNVGNIISCGISACTTFQECNLLNAFTVTTGSTTCSFSSLTLDDLKSLSMPDYNKRVNYFFEYVGIQDSRLKNNLFSGATFYNQDCDITCKLNSDFLIYRFLDGVRVVNVGEANGEVEYLAYPIDEDPSGYTWQSNGTFLGLDLSKAYFFKIRDNLNGEIICEYEKQQSLPLLLLSTTVTLTPVEISLNETVRRTGGISCFSYSEAISTPELTSGQRVSVSYETDMNYFGGGSAYMAIYCQRPVDSGYVEYSRYTEMGAGSFEMNNNTDWCFRIVANTPIVGASAQAEFCLNSVSGLGTTVPSINPGSCSLSVSKCIQPIDVTASTVCTIGDDPVAGVCYENGCINFDRPVPIGNCMILQMSATTNVAGTSDASVIFYCKPNGSTSPPVQINRTFGGATCTPTIIARYGDLITYSMAVDAQDPGTSATAKFCIDSASGSYGVNTYISPNNCRGISQSTTLTPSVVSVCSQNNTTTSPTSDNAQMDGFINATGIDNTNKCVRVNLCVDLDRPHGSGNITIRCKPNGSSTFFDLLVRSTTASSIETFDMCQGDVVCYVASLYAIPLSTDTTGCAYICLDSVVGYGGVSASINTLADKQCDSIRAFAEGTGTLV